MCGVSQFHIGPNVAKLIFKVTLGECLGWWECGSSTVWVQEERRFFDAVKKIGHAKRCRILDPRTDNVFIDSPFTLDFQISEQEKAIEALSRALATIVATLPP